MLRKMSLILGIILPCVILALPLQAIPINGITVVEQRLLAIFVFAVIFWVFEIIPIFATSVLIIVFELVTVSDSGLIWLRQDAGGDRFGALISHQEIFHTFASPIILLFLGGFFLAEAATKYRLDINLARVVLKPFGKRPAMVLLGMMIITAFFSMFMSNTATTAMMLALITPVLAAFDRDDPGRIGILISVPFAANIGGLGTPIGSPPNAVAMKYLTGDIAVSFAEWMAFAVPYVIVLVAVTWLVLLFFFRPTSQEIHLQIKGRFVKTPRALTVYATFIVTIALWLFGEQIGLNSYVVAMIPVAVFSATGVITAGDLKKMSWDVLWLVAGGIALGVGLEKTGLSERLVASIPFAQFPPIVILAMSVSVALLMATFMSHTVTANLIIPMIAALGTSLPSLEPLGGAKMLIIAGTFGSSLSMVLPISTPPNAMAYALGLFKTSDMFKAGLAVNIVGFFLVFAMLYILKFVGFLG